MDENGFRKVPSWALQPYFRVDGTLKNKAKTQEATGDAPQENPAAREQKEDSSNGTGDQALFEDADHVSTNGPIAPFEIDIRPGEDEKVFSADAEQTSKKRLANPTELDSRQAERAAKKGAEYSPVTPTNANV